MGCGGSIVDDETNNDTTRGSGKDGPASKSARTGKSSHKYKSGDPQTIEMELSGRLTDARQASDSDDQNTSGIGAMSHKADGGKATMCGSLRFPKNGSAAVSPVASANGDSNAEKQPEVRSADDAYDMLGCMDQSFIDFDLQPRYEQLLKEALAAFETHGLTNVAVNAVPISSVGQCVELSHSDLVRIRTWTDFTPQFPPIPVLVGAGELSTQEGVMPREAALQQNQEVLDSHYLQASQLGDSKC
eukprot:Rhum_TRINITY_DN14508_c13_g1::Rhum_TRINITY_DN14508_c13_g1_i1::g.94765::m.94765